MKSISNNNQTSTNISIEKMEENNNTNNIIAFPEEAIVYKSEDILIDSKISEESIKERLYALKYMHIDESVEYIFPPFFTQLSVLGFHITGEEYKKENGFIVEAVRAVLLKKHGIYHPIQTIIDNIFIEEDGDLRFKDELKELKFDPD